MAVRSNPALGLCALALMTVLAGAAGQVYAQARGSAPVLRPQIPSPTPDMDMPDDLGAPLNSVTEQPEPTTPHTLSVDTPVGVIASVPQGKAVLERDLPGLCERPEFIMFKGMSLTKLATLSHGRISEAKLSRVQADLTRAGATDSQPRSHNLLLTGGRNIERLSRSIYRRVVLVIASL